MTVINWRVNWLVKTSIESFLCFDNKLWNCGTLDKRLHTQHHRLHQPTGKHYNLTFVAVCHSQEIFVQFWQTCGKIVGGTQSTLASTIRNLEWLEGIHIFTLVVFSVARTTACIVHCARPRDITLVCSVVRSVNVRVCLLTPNILFIYIPHSYRKTIVYLHLLLKIFGSHCRHGNCDMCVPSHIHTMQDIETQPK